MNPSEPKPRGLVLRARGCLVALAATLAAVMVLGFVVFQLRAPLLTRVGGVLYHEDPLAPADAIAVLSGGGARPYDRGGGSVRGRVRAGRVAYTYARKSGCRGAAGRVGSTSGTDLELQLDYLDALGVPLDATTVLQRVVDSTQTEAALIAEWAESRQLGRIIVVTAGYHTSRARLVFDRVLRGHATEILIRPSGISGFAPDTWWHTRSDRRNGLFELEKYLYYRVMYLLRLTP